MYILATIQMIYWSTLCKLDVCYCRSIMMLGVVLGMLLRVVGLRKMLHKKLLQKRTMKLIKMQKMELTMGMVSTNSS